MLTKRPSAAGYLCTSYHSRLYVTSLFTPITVNYKYKGHSRLHFCKVWKQLQMCGGQPYLSVFAHYKLLCLSSAVEIMISTS